VRGWRFSRLHSAIAALCTRACAHQLWAMRARTASRTAWFPGRSWKGCSGGAEPHLSLLLPQGTRDNMCSYLLLPRAKRQTRVGCVQAWPLLRLSLCAV